MNIQPLSELRNYTALLNQVRKDAPVFLTKNGRGMYVILQIEDYERMREAEKK